MSAASRYRLTIDRLLADAGHAAKRLEEERTELRRARAQAAAAAEAQRLLQEVAEQVQRRAYQQIEAVVTRCLSVLPAPYTFRLALDKKRGKTEVRPVYLDAGGHEVSPTEASEGGALDVASFALRIAVLALKRPRPRAFLVLDEPFRFVSESNRPRVRGMLEAVASEMGVQVVMITHDRDMRSDDVVDFGPRNPD